MKFQKIQSIHKGKDNMTTNKSCFVCDKFHSLQFPESEHMYTCDDHTYITKKEAADYCSVTTRTIERAVSNGVLPSYIIDVVGTGEVYKKVGRKMNRYSLADLKKLVKKEVK